MLDVCGVDHVAFETRQDQLETSIKIMVELLGAQHIPNKAIEGDWGISRFYNLTGKTIQLTTPRQHDNTNEETEYHLGLQVDNPDEKAKEAEDWAQEVGFEFLSEAINNGRWMISFPKILAFWIELVPCNDL